jgi:hypothetical protein
MSLLISFGLKDLEKCTVELMNILYDSDWSDDISAFNDDFLFKRIGDLHTKIITDLKVDNPPEKNGSELFTIANRLSTIDNALFGSSEHIPDAVSIKWCIAYTEAIIKQLCMDQRSFCFIQ